MTLPIAPIGNEFKLPSLTGPETTGSTGGSSFGKALTDSLDKLSASQADADTQAQQLATGQAQDVSSVVMSVEKASLELQLATQVRNKAVDAYQEIFRMSV